MLSKQNSIFCLVNLLLMGGFFGCAGLNVAASSWTPSCCELQKSQQFGFSRSRRELTSYGATSGAKSTWFSCNRGTYFTFLNQDQISSVLFCSCKSISQLKWIKWNWLDFVFQHKVSLQHNVLFKRNVTRTQN